MTGHLGRRVSRLVDGELTAEELDRALGHLARCSSCRSAVEAERRAQAALRRLSAPAPSPALLDSLRRIGEGPAAGLPTANRPRGSSASSGRPPGRGGDVGPRDGRGESRPASRRPGGPGRPVERHALAPVRGAVAAVGLAGVSLTMAVLAAAAAPGASTGAPVSLRPAATPAGTTSDAVFRRAGASAATLRNATTMVVGAAQLSGTTGELSLARARR